MSQCDRVFAVLADGKPHAMREIHERAGFMRLNSRISELRSKRNLFIYCWHADGDWRYQLILLDEGTADPLGAGRLVPSSSVSSVGVPAVTSSAPATGDLVRCSAPEQLSVWAA